MPRALYEQLGAKGRVFSVLTRLFYRRFKWNTAVTDAAGEELASLGVPRSTIRTVPNGIDFARIEQLAAEDLSGPDDDLPLVVAAGRLAPEKGYEVLIEAHGLARASRAAPADDLRAGAGAGAARGADPRARPRGHGLTRGYVPNHYPWIRRASLLCLSSYHEGMPLVLIEALSLGTPVVATRCSEGVADLLREGELGALVEPGSPPRSPRDRYPSREDPRRCVLAPSAPATAHARGGRSRRARRGTPRSSSPQCGARVAPWPRARDRPARCARRAPLRSSPRVQRPPRRLPRRPARSTPPSPAARRPRRRSRRRRAATSATSASGWSTRRSAGSSRSRTCRSTRRAPLPDPGRPRGPARPRQRQLHGGVRSDDGRDAATPAGA